MSTKSPQAPLTFRDRRFQCVCHWVAPWLGLLLRRLQHDPGQAEKRKDESSHRERAEVHSASLTLMQGVCVGQPDGHRRSGRVVDRPTDMVDEAGPEPFQEGWASLRPLPPFPHWLPWSPVQ